MLTVAIAVEPPAQFADGPRAISESCEEVLGRGRCVAAADLGSQRVVTWYAVVVIDAPDSSTWRVEFRDRAKDGVLIESRTLAFSGADTLQTRWRSIGTIVAALVTARDQGTPALPQPMPCVPRQGAPPIAQKPEPTSELFWGIDLATLFGPGLDEGAYRFGGLMRLHLASSAIPGALGLVSLRYAERPGERLGLTWWSGSAGLGARIGGNTSTLSAELTGELVFERMLMHATSASGTQSDTTGQNRLGGRLGLNGVWAAWRPLALLVGVETSVLRPSVQVQVGGDVVGRAPLFGFAFSLGVRLALN